MRKLLAPLCALAALVALSDNARAVVVTASSGPFSAGNSNTNNDITFDGLATPNTFAGTSIQWGAAPASLGGIAFSGTAIIAKNAAGTSAGISATPAGDTTNYMSILGGKSETLTFSGTQNKFGLYWGSIDSYNSVAFYLGNSATPFLTLFGNTLNAVPALGFNGDQSGALTNAYVTFTGLSFDKIVLASSGNSFEFDNISYGNVGPVPEPSTWAMMLLGFAGLGYVYRRRRSRLAVTAA
jgi:fibronectin-binding autotransporter adhesin